MGGARHRVGRAHMGGLKDLFDRSEDNMQIKQSPNGEIYRRWVAAEGLTSSWVVPTWSA